MRWLACAAWALSATAVAWAQNTTPLPATQVAAERSRIAAERASIAQRFAQEERACHQRFAVNDCLNANRKWQRGALADLRRQEIVLNDSERQRKAAERMDRLDEKSQTHTAEEAQRPVVPEKAPHAPPRPVGGKLPKEVDASGRVVDPAAIRQHQERMERKEQRHQDAQAHRAEQAAQAPEQQRRQEQRVREAQDRKARVMERNAEQPSKALPLPAPAR